MGYSKYHESSALAQISRLLKDQSADVGHVSMSETKKARPRNGRGKNENDGAMHTSSDNTKGGLSMNH